MNLFIRSIFLPAFLSCLMIQAQTAFPPAPAGLPSSFELLRKPTFPLDNPLEAEQLLELVHTQVYASHVNKEFQRLRFPLSGIIQSAGLRWERLNMEKQRFIGTFSRHMKMFDGFSDEFDLNLFLVPHLDRYILLEREALDRTLLRGRDFDDVKADTVPFPCPPELRHNGKCIAVECEVTPSDGAQEILPDAILPIQPGVHNTQEHPSFGTEHPSMGVMGVWCADCNHNCRPEIHPIELMWWMSPGTTDSVVWNVVSLSDASKRFPDWTGPVNARVEVPLLLDSDLRITLVPILMNGKATWLEEEMTESVKAQIPASNGGQQTITLRQPSSLQAVPPLLFSTDFISHDQGTNYGHLALQFTSQDAFAMKVVVERIAAEK